MRLSIVCLLVLLATPALAQERGAEHVVDVPNRPGAPVRVLTAVPRDAVGAVILQAGGNGILNIQDDGRIGALNLNQLVRTRALYTAVGFATLVPDVPQDIRRTPQYLASVAHAEDLGAVIAYARTLAPRVYLVGTSNGAVTVAAAMTLQTRALPDAAVITSGVLISRQNQLAADRTGDLARVRVPVLLLSHERDACPFSEPQDRLRLRALMRNAPRVDLATLRGGTAAGTDPCEFNAYHGFNGIDAEVVAAVTEWLNGTAR